MYPLAATNVFAMIEMAATYTVGDSSGMECFPAKDLVKLLGNM